MLINAHILHADEQLNIAMQLAKRLPDSIDKNLLICALHGVQAELFMMSVDYEKITTENTQLHRQLYEPIVQAQAARKCKYIDEDALAKTGTYSYNEFEKKLEQACQGTAKSLGEFLRKYERIGISTSTETASDASTNTCKHTFPKCESMVLSIFPKTSNPPDKGGFFYVR